MVIFFDEENITFTCIFVIHKLFNLDLDFLKKVKIETKSWSKIPSYPFTIFIRFFSFQGVRKEDDGFYICSALSVAGSSVTKAYLEVTAIEDQPPPIIAMGPANQTLPINTIAVLPCQASGNPKPSIRWFKDQKAITQTESSRLMVEETGTLVIDSKDDAYIYTIVYTGSPHIMCFLCPGKFLLMVDFVYN